MGLRSFFSFILFLEIFRGARARLPVCDCKFSCINFERETQTFYNRIFTTPLNRATNTSSRLLARSRPLLIQVGPATAFQWLTSVDLQP